jgi:hypothetical protein
MDLSVVLGVGGGVLIAGSFIPYIRDIYKADTEPHVYTWFIWSLTQAIAAMAILEGAGGQFAALSIASGAVLSFVVFILSFKHGTKNVTHFDTIALITAIAAIFMWWKLDHPQWAVVTIATIDLIGFIPTIRKTWYAPKTESQLAWSLFAIGNVLTFFSLSEYNILTSFYIITMCIASFALVGIITLRHKRHF